MATDFVRRHSNLALAHETPGWPCFKQGAAEDALRAYQRTIELEPANPELYAGRGAALSLVGRHRDAIQSFCLHEVNV